MKITNNMKERMIFSFEIFPPKSHKPIEPLLKILDDLYDLKPDLISCTYGAGGSNAGLNMEICKAIKDSNRIIPMTHYTCIGNTREKIKSELNQYLQIGVNHILALRGDYPKGQRSTGGDFNYANELIAYIREEFPEFCIAVSGNPEKHYEANSFDSDITYLRMKQDAGGDFIMTQLCYDIDQYSWWVERIRRAGVKLPINVGIMPVLNKDVIIKMTLQNGSSIPRDLAEIISRYGDNNEDFKKAGIDYTINQIHKYINTGVNGLHIYTLNNYDDILKIVKGAGLR
ncbi:MAG: 5,10-methylenetetrahydrofolate reductase [Clostridiales bacterium]|nr:5,10-methylenetetrahydrofolate reductase [Clostridiales bacterium]